MEAHLYQIVEFFDGRKSWWQCDADATARGGHLVTITSEVEHSFVLGVYLQPPFVSGTFFIGIEDDGAHKPVWVTREPIVYRRTLDLFDTVASPTLAASFRGYYLWLEDDATAVGYLLEYELTTANPNFDTDQDGLTDGDEVTNWHTDPNNPDTDGDGFTDFNEVKFQSDPLDPAIIPGAILAIQPAIEIEIATLPGALYDVQASNDLSNWSVIPPQVAGNGQTVYQLYSAREHSMRYWRVVRVK